MSGFGNDNMKDNQVLGDIVDWLGTTLHLPEWGVSEKIAGGKTLNTGKTQSTSNTKKATGSNNGGGGNNGGGSNNGGSNYGGGGYGGGSSSQSSNLASLRSQIQSYLPQISQAYNTLNDMLNNMVKSKTDEINNNAGESINKLTDEYTSSLPTIQNTYAGRGLADSTYEGDAEDTAGKNYKSSVADVGKQRDTDIENLGQTAEQNRAAWNADQQSINDIINRLGSDTDEYDLVDKANSMASKVNSLNAEKGSLNTNSALKSSVDNTTAGDTSAYDAINSSLQELINSSMPNSTKAAAVTAAADSAGLTSDQKNAILKNNAYLLNNTDDTIKKNSNQ